MSSGRKGHMRTAGLLQGLDSPPKCWEQNGSGYDEDEGKHLLVHQQ